MGGRFFDLRRNNVTTQTKTETSTLETSFQEAPASWNTRYVHPSGFECQITLRGETGAELLEKVEKAIEYLLKVGCQPYTYVRNGAKPAANGNQNGEGWCPIHSTQMKRWEKDGRNWYSHKTSEGWCSGR